VSHHYVTLARQIFHTNGKLDMNRNLMRKFNKIVEPCARRTANVLRGDLSAWARLDAGRLGIKEGIAAYQLLYLSRKGPLKLKRFSVPDTSIKPDWFDLEKLPPGQSWWNLVTTIRPDRPPKRRQWHYRPKLNFECSRSWILRN